MRLLLLLLQLAAQIPMPDPPPPPAIFQIQQEPVPSQGPHEGKWAHHDGHRCYRGEEQEAIKLHHCECQLKCDENGNGREDDRCVTYCGSQQCVCHADEACDMPEPPR